MRRLLVLLLFPACARAPLTPDPRRTLEQIPYDSLQMMTHVYRPDGAGPFPIVVFLHGRSPNATDRRGLTYPVPSGHAHYWLDKGFAVVAPIRPGYGQTGGDDDSEANGGSVHGHFCSATPNFRRVAEQASAVAAETIAWVRNQPWADTSRIVIVGQSVGGMAAIATCARALPGVIACINFSGGSGGFPERSPNQSCHPELLSDLFHSFGATASVPSLWLYAPNDHFWGETAPHQWFDAFQAGGGHGAFVATLPVENEGHDLLRRGGKKWSSAVDDFVRALSEAP